MNFQGDRGGNECQIDTKKSNISDSLSNLHKVWDSAGGLYPNDPFYPPGGPGLTSKYKAMFEEQANELVLSFVCMFSAVLFVSNNHVDECFSA